MFRHRIALALPCVALAGFLTMGVGVLPANAAQPSSVAGTCAFRGSGAAKGIDWTVAKNHTFMDNHGDSGTWSVSGGTYSFAFTSLGCTFTGMKTTVGFNTKTSPGAYNCSGFTFTWWAKKIAT
jgi:hypothetical protein